MKVLITLSQLKGHGGIPRFNQNLIDAISDHHSPMVLSLNDHSFGDVRGAGASKARLLFLFFKAILSKPEVILLGHLNLLPILVLKFLSKAKVVVVLHGIDAWEPKKGSNLFYKKVDEFWSVSQYTKEKFCQVSGVDQSKVQKIFNTLPKTWPVNHDKRKEEKYFFTVTRVDKSEGYKGIDKTIEVVSQLQEKLRINGWKFKAVLSGDDVQRHKEMVVDMGVSDLVDFHTGVSDEELGKLYAHCSFFILPSNGEGFGIVFLEAMSHAKPCIGARNCGSEDVIDHGQSGYLINPDLKEIGVAIAVLVDKKGLRIEMGQKGNDKLNREFTYDKFSKVINEYLAVCAG